MYVLIYKYFLNVSSYNTTRSSVNDTGKLITIQIPPLKIKNILYIGSYCIFLLFCILPFSGMLNQCLIKLVLIKFVLVMTKHKLNI